MKLYMQQNRLHMDWCQSADASPLFQEEAGQSYNHAEPGECADHLLELRAKGFIVPQWAIKDLRAEQAEMDAEDRSL